MPEAEERRTLEDRPSDENVLESSEPAHMRGVSHGVEDLRLSVPLA